ncbi:MAG: hypothetical protein PHE84_01260 [bacterium]|nr:hypothetical protein [bacterium]
MRKFEELIRCRRLELVNEKGEIRAMLEVLDRQGPFFVLHDRDGNSRMQFDMCASSYGPMFVLSDPKDKCRVLIALTEDGTPYLDLHDANGMFLKRMPSTRQRGKSLKVVGAWVYAMLQKIWILFNLSRPAHKSEKIQAD